MSEMRTLEELEEFANSLSMSDLKTLVGSDEVLSRQLSFTQPTEFSIAERDLSSLRVGQKCILWGKDPNNGWVCLKWE
jgi:hypothetical protein